VAAVRRRREATAIRPGRLSRRAVLAALAGVAATGGRALAAAVPAALSPRGVPPVKSGAVLIAESATKRVLFEKNAQSVQPIASITKLMTAMVVLDAKQDPDERIEILETDKSKLKFARSRLYVGTVATRGDLLQVALMASDNRAAAALARTYPGGFDAAIAAMNAKARALGLADTRFDDPTGLSAGNVSTAADLMHLIAAARVYKEIREDSTAPALNLQTNRGAIGFVNTNGIARREGWDIDLSKTGFIAEAGRCLVLHARIAAHPIAIVLLDAAGKYTAIADAHRVRHWLEPGYTPPKGAVARDR
jgi:serine-type D-Ala-D-Ala endopeptidase (penicillin-binding protein 7)